MKRKATLTLVLGIGLAAALGLVTGLALAKGGMQVSVLADTAPTMVSYQGEVLVNGVPYSGTGYFKFAVVNFNDTSTYWSNDGTSSGQPTSAVSLTVQDGLFAVLLGNPVPPYNMPAITASVFADKGRRLHVWFDADGVAPFTDLGLTYIAAVPYALNAETLDGQDGSAFQQHYDHVVVVAKSGGDYTTIGAALASITDNSAASRYLVWVGPGTYTETVTMKPYVDIEGAGELLTTISYIGSASPYTGTVAGASDAELRFLTVRNTGGDRYATAIYNSSAAPRLTHVTASASGGISSTYGVYNTNTSSPVMVNVTASASGGEDARGVYNSTSSSPTMVDVTASAFGGSVTSFGVFNSTSSPTMTRVTVSASGGSDNEAVYNYYSSPTMVDVTASASGGNYCYGVFNYSSSPMMTRVTASASGATTYTYGVRNYSSSPTMIGVIASASGGVYIYGVRNFSSSPTIQNSTLSAGGDSGSRYGLYSAAPSSAYTVTVDNCQITGFTNSIYNDDGDNNYTTYVGASLLDGPVTGTGTETCVFSYDGTYAALDTDCTPLP